MGGGRKEEGGRTGPDEAPLTADERGAVEHILDDRIVRDLDADVPVQTRRYDPRNEAHHVPDRLPAVLAHTLVRDPERELALVAVHEQPCPRRQSSLEVWEGVSAP